MKYSRVVGKSVQQLEQEMLPRGKKQKDYKKALLVVSLSVVTMIMMVILWNSQQEITQLHGQIDQLEKKNAEIIRENVTITKENAVKTKDNSTSAKEKNDVVYYEIQQGDSFSTISQHYYGTEAFAVQLAQINGLELEKQLKLGQIVKVPKKLN